MDDFEELRLIESIVESSPVIIFRWIISEGWPVEYVSKNVSQLGYTQQDLLAGAVSWPGITHPDDEARLEREVKSFLEGGRGNARDIVDTVDSVRARNRWHRYFDGFTFPYAFCSPEEYSRWLKEAGLEPRRIELIPKDMTQRGRDGLAGWIRTTWLPYTERIPEELREEFIEEVVSLYTERFPVDDRGLVRVRMVRLEVEAVSPS